MFDPIRPVGDGIAVLNLLSPSFFKRDVKRSAVHQVMFRDKKEPVYLRSFCAEGTNVTFPVFRYSFELFNSPNETKARG